jgi:hypothetical protein
MVETDGTFESFAGILVEEQKSRGSLMHKQKLHYCEISQLVYSSNSKTSQILQLHPEDQEYIPSGEN